MRGPTPFRSAAATFARAPVAALALVLHAPSLDAQAPASEAAPVEHAVESFEYVWRSIRDTHWQENPGGLDWRAVYDDFAPRIAAAQNQDEVRGVLSEMLGLLGQSHFGILPATAYADLETGSGGAYTTGLDVRVVDSQAVVTEVVRGGPADAAGVRPGWALERINGRSIDVMIERLIETARTRGLEIGLVLTTALNQRLNGAPGSALRLAFLDADDALVELELPTAPPRGTMTRFGNLPPVPVWHEERRFGSATYFRFNAFLDVPRIMPAFEQAVRGCEPCDGIVVDLRGNMGGIAAMAMGMAGFLTAERNLRLGTMYTRDVELNFVVNPRRDPFEGPVAVLIDAGSASTAEIFAGGLQDHGRARVFGTRSAGAALPSMIERLPNGDGFQHAFANYVSAGGETLEGNGVVPDVVVELERRALLAGEDPVLAAALEWIGLQSP